MYFVFQAHDKMDHCMPVDEIHSQRPLRWISTPKRFYQDSVRQGVEVNENLVFIRFSYCFDAYGLHAASYGY